MTDTTARVADLTPAPRAPGRAHRSPGPYPYRRRTVRRYPPHTPHPYRPHTPRTYRPHMASSIASMPRPMDSLHTWASSGRSPQAAVPETGTAAAAGSSRAPLQST